MLIRAFAMTMQNNGGYSPALTLSDWHQTNKNWKPAGLVRRKR